MPAPAEPPLETSAPRSSPPPPLPARVAAVLALHDHGLLDAPTSRRALAGVRRGVSLADALEGAGVPRSLRDKADELLRPTATRLDGAAALVLALVPPALALLAGELTRVAGMPGGAALIAAGGGALAFAPLRLAKRGGAAVATGAALALCTQLLPSDLTMGLALFLVAASAASFALRPVGARSRSGAGGLLAGAAIEALRSLATT